ncbi:hypothetical protein CCP3SC15_10052 [Gammaproteobacteria bacterium]
MFFYFNFFFGISFEVISKTLFKIIKILFSDNVYVHLEPSRLELSIVKSCTL